MRKIPLHPFLFALSPILFFYSYNKAELSITNSDFLITLGVSVFAAAVLVIVLKFLTKSTFKSAIIVSLFILLFFTYGHVRGLVKEFNINVLGIIDVGPDKVLLSAWGFIFLAGAYLTLKIKKDLKKATGFLNFVAATAVVLSLADIIPYEIRTYKPTEGETQENLSEIIAEVTPEEAKKFPDIYYLVFDRYTNNINLQNNFDFDNSEFTNYLEDKGFYIAEKSRMNYASTTLSLPSSLNMKYLTYLADEMGENSTDKEPIYELIQNYEVWRFLKKKGYTFIHFGSWWTQTKSNKYADINMNYTSGIQNEFVARLLETTLYHPISKRIYPDLPFRDTHRKRITYKFKELLKMSKVEGPKFVFVHFLVTHNPYVFDKDGKTITEEEEKSRGDKLNYTESIIFTNKYIKEFVDKATLNSEKPPIIVIQADEGHYPHGNLDKLAEITSKELQGYMGILNAYYLPGLDYEEILYQDITPVNTFRVIFNGYFETDYKLLEDRSYIFKDRKRLYDLVEVTDKVRFD